MRIIVPNIIFSKSKTSNIFSIIGRVLLELITEENIRRVLPSWNLKIDLIFLEIR